MEQPLSLEKKIELLWEEKSNSQTHKTQEQQAKRQQLFRETAALQEEQAKLPELQCEVEKARGVTVETYAAYQQALRHYEQLYGEYQQLTLQLSTRLERLENKLRDSANPQIQEAIDSWHRRMTKARENFQVRVIRGDYNVESGQYQRIEQDNAEAIQHVVNVLNAAVEQAKALKLLDLSEQEVQERLDAIEMSIPKDVPSLSVLDTGPLTPAEEALARKGAQDFAKAHAQVIEKKHRRDSWMKRMGYK